MSTTNDFLDLIADPPEEPTPSRGELDRFRLRDTPDWVVEFNRTHTWGEFLDAVGFTHVRTGRDGVQHLARPGKDPRLGSSATVNFAGLDGLYIFSTGGPHWLPVEKMIDRYGFMVRQEQGTADPDWKLAAKRHGPPLEPTSRVRSVDPVTGEIGADDRDDDGSHLLPEDFWSARPVLGHIRAAAHSRTRSGDAVFHAVLARVAGCVPHTVKLPAIVGAPAPLNYFVAVNGPPGSGKSSAEKVAGELAPVPPDVDVLDGLPIGSGEGLAEVLFDAVKEPDPITGKTVTAKRQVRYNAIVFIDEGDALTALGSRSASTTLSTLRTIWSGGTLGQTNASQDRRRIVPAGQYAYGVIMGLQPSLAGPLLEDGAAGTPQRFAWAWAVDPAIPDDPPAWPGPLPVELPTIATLGDGRRLGGGFAIHEIDVDSVVAQEIRTRALDIARGDVVPDAQDAHTNLLRLKVAGLLGILDGRLGVNQEDWELAGVVVDTSRAVRSKVQEIVAADAAEKERSTAVRLARRAATADGAVEDGRVERAARKLRSKVADAGGSALVSEVRRRCTAGDRAVFEDAVAHAVAEGWLLQDEQPGQGQPKRVLRSAA